MGGYFNGGYAGCHRSGFMGDRVYVCGFRLHAFIYEKKSLQKFLDSWVNSLALEFIFPLCLGFKNWDFINIYESKKVI